MELQEIYKNFIDKIKNINSLTSQYEPGDLFKILDIKANIEELINFIEANEELFSSSFINSFHSILSLKIKVKNLNDDDIYFLKSFGENFLKILSSELDFQDFKNFLIENLSNEEIESNNIKIFDDDDFENFYHNFSLENNFQNNESEKNEVELKEEKISINFTLDEMVNDTNLLIQFVN